MQKYRCRHYDRPCYKADDNGDVYLVDEVDEQIEKLTNERDTWKRRYEEIKEATSELLWRIDNRYYMTLDKEILNEINEVIDKVTCWHG